MLGFFGLEKLPNITGNILGKNEADCNIVLIREAVTDDELFYTFSYSSWKKSTCVQTLIYFTKHCNMPDKACHCSYDPLFMLVMFCCLTLSGSAETLSGLEIHPRSHLRPAIVRSSKETEWARYGLKDMI